MRTKMDFDHERGMGFRSKRFCFIPVVFVAGVFIISGVVMFLWNAILPGVTAVHAVTYWQAMGILVLSRILFGGFRGIHDHGRHHHRHLGKDLREKWLQMDPEERQKMRENLKNEWKQKSESTEKPQ
jgi:hypothetical protein